MAAGTFFKTFTNSDRTTTRTLLHESIPITGTNARKINEIKNNGMMIFFKKDVSMIDINIINVNATKVKLKCFEKKK